MTWFKVDDKFPTSPKVMRIPREARLAAVGLWTLAGAWSAAQEQDGHVPAYMVSEWCPDGTIAGHLVTAGLWVETGDGYAFHDWAEYQPTRADNDARRETQRLRKEEWRRKKAEKSTQSHGDVPTGHVDEGTRDTHGTDGLVLSIPTRPDPTPKRTSAPAVLVTEHDFDEAWKFWPKKTERKKSLEKFKAVARRRGVEVLTADIRRFGEAYAKSTERRFVPALNVWLGGERWTDELPGTETPGARQANGDDWMWNQ